MEENLEQEYDEVFDDEEKVSNNLKITMDKFTREYKTIQIKDIGLSEATKLGRKQTMSGLAKSVEELGVVTPIHVMTTEQADDEDDDDVYKYMLLDGLRRVVGALKAGFKEIDAIVWDFKDKDLGKQVSLALGLTLSKAQRRNWGEVWDLYQVLELQSNVTPGTVESLLQLEPGDAMKLKDCMLCDYSEVKEALLCGDKTLDGCYKMLQKLRKEEDTLAKEEITGISDTVEGAEDIAQESAETAERMSEEDVLDLLEMADTMNDDVSDADFSELNSGDTEYQKVGERHPVDPAIRQGTFQRDEFHCRCCGTGGVAFLGTLIYHHAVPVHAGGPDTIENGLTLCDSCHQILHIAEKNGGKLPMTKEQFESYSDEQQTRIKKILKFSKIAVEASKRKGISHDKVVAEANKSGRHRMPGENLKETQQAYMRAGEK